MEISCTGSTFYGSENKKREQQSRKLHTIRNFYNRKDTIIVKVDVCEKKDFREEEICNQKIAI